MKVNIGRVGIAYVIFILIAIGALVKMVLTQFVNIPDVPDVVGAVTRNDEIESHRGSILSDDGRYLAFSIPEYQLYMDLHKDVIADTLFENNVEALSVELAKLYRDRSAAEYKKFLETAREEQRRYVCINKQLLKYQEMKLVKTFPILKYGPGRGGIIIEEVDHREYPYDRLAYRTLGHLKRDQDQMKVGLEGSCDSILRGKPGIRPMKRTEGNQWIPDSERAITPPVNGTDIRTTLNVDIQNIADRALRNKLSQSEELQAGTVIVMDVTTGEIKAMVNLEKHDGNYSERYNYAIGRIGEPGSVFKLTSLAILLETGKVKLEDEMPAYVYYKIGKKTFEDEYLRNYDKITIQRGFEISSNNVFRAQVWEHFGSKPENYMDQLKAMKIDTKHDIEIHGIGNATIPHPSDTVRYWSDIDLASVSIGYAVEMTPLHIITLYNAIANNGVMVRPHLISEYLKDGQTIEKVEPEVLSTICSESTAKQLHKALRGVVMNGTGKNSFNGCKVEVAGKTGTARVVIPTNGAYIDSQGRKIHQGTFVGFFPYKNPRYTVIAVVYSGLTNKNFYGGTWAGPVVREIVDNIYASSPEWNGQMIASGELPVYKEYPNRTVNDTLSGVPDVMGMGLKNSISTLESRGYSVSFSGHGVVVKQEPEPGSDTSNRKVKIYLAEKYATE
ncbi:MAG TPA: penicillin-binding transpeptidase domain-containing protein [Bacteroidales bacterium]|jgi:cell division protein FtsI (penicillin-binding protein 3)|nr:PASTA domain-containing protein [Bacteroidales bacterium]HPB89242.1 penicillin-binding transpeptidase domain-containing protein [Bacteroidales bacterium]HPY21672.1 penicillin-binding transpeptidase domain-containing protein [Bacteroidales bacterium]HQA92884.1 penicillin-binding transpeptidase domain-containing protein [Bacteroidales bacterium]HQN23518.1 penicillin-binding transpeptidase domain-containing protein [Bacteroidales bacterium]